VDYVFFDADAIERRDESGNSSKMSWSDLAEVSIQTTNAGPAVDDMYFILTAADGHKLTIPSQASGADTLLAHLQQLPGFDNQAVIDASSCTENASFPCWKKP